LKEICLKESFFCGEREKNSAGQKEERKKVWKHL
jgi:hypothetical protein